MAATGLEVTLHQGRERAEVSRFTRTLDEIVLSLREIDQVYLTRATRATWVLADLKHRRDNLIVRLEARDVPSAREITDMLVPVKAFVDGAQTLQSEPAVPALWKPQTVSRLAELAAPKKGVQTVSLATYNGDRGRRVKLSDRVKDNATAAVDTYQISYGTVTGKLIGVREVDKAGLIRCLIRDELHRAALDAIAPLPLADQLAEAWRHRVMLGGKVRRNTRGQAISMIVDRVELMPEDDTGRPDPMELLGALGPDPFDGASVDEAIAQMRRE